VLQAARGIFRAVGTTVVPEAARLSETEWAESEATVESALAARPLRMQRQLVLLLRVIEWLPLIRYGRRFSQLDPQRRTRFLAALQDAPVLLLRRGVWGLRTLCLMGYYGRAAAAREIGYRGDPRGWSARA
jgi:hypothetical protein